MRRQDWLSLVAVHSDSWLMAVAFFNGARLDAEGRRQLFNDVNSLPTSFEIVTGRATSNKPPAGGVQVSKRPAGHPGDALKQLSRRPAGRKYYDEEEQEDAEVEEEEEEEGGAGYGGGGSDPCPNCGRLYRQGEFWIACDACDRWFDGKCVNMTAQKAERNSEWQCPFCARG
jgi:hypothetical protein